MRVLGLDISTKCGIVVYDDVKGVLKSMTAYYPKQDDRYNRWYKYIGHLYDAIEHHHPIDFAVIENYGFARVQNIVPLVELGTLFRHTLEGENISWIEVAPSSLKKFTSGKGNASKADMIKAVASNWDFVTSDDNIADAYALARLGHAAYYNVEGLSEKSIEVVEFIRDKYVEV